MISLFTEYRGERLNANFTRTMTCDSQPMYKAVFYRSKTSAVVIHRLRRDGNLVALDWKSERGTWNRLLRLRYQALPN